jgi:hypothetical protein
MLLDTPVGVAVGRLYNMKRIVVRLSWVILLWTGTGLGSWMCGREVGVAGAFLGMFSGADLYRAMGTQKKRFSLMFVLGASGVPFGLFYEHLAPTTADWSSLARIVACGIAVGGAFGLFSSLLGLVFRCEVTHDDADVGS